MKTQVKDCDQQEEILYLDHKNNLLKEVPYQFLQLCFQLPRQNYSN
jgi:hypothetical protein